MTVRRKIAGLCAAATVSLALAPLALAAPAGDEYLPKVPGSGAHSSASGSSDSAGTPTTTLPTGGTSSPSSSDTDKSKSDDTGKKDEQKIAPVGSADSGGSDGGGDSGSLLFNPIVLLVIAAVVAVAVGMTLRRRRVDEADSESPGTTGRAGDRGASPRTPDGEIATGPDRIS
jgi:hypothetical protein